MVDVEQGTLRALEEHPTALLHRVEQEGGRIGDVGPKPFCVGGVLGVDRRRVERGGGAGRPGGEQPILEGHDMLDLLAEVGTVEVAEPDGQGAADLVAVAGSDAPARGPDRTAAREARVEQPILDDMPRKDHVGPVADLQLTFHPQAA